MNKSEMTRQLAKQLRTTVKEAKKSVDLFWRELEGSLIRGEGIEIRGFANFTVRGYDAYTGRNPRTGDPVEVPAKKLPHFRASRKLTQRVNSKVRVLIADDMPMMLDMLCLTLERNFEQLVIRTVRDGKEALEAVEHWAPDILVTNFVLPGMKGGEIIDRLLSEDRRFPILVASGVAKEEQLEALGRAHGIDTDQLVLLGKPFSPQVYAEMVARVIAIVEEGRG